MTSTLKNFKKELHCVNEKMKGLDEDNYSSLELFDIIDDLLKKTKDLQDVCRKDIVALKKTEQLESLRERYQLGIK